MPPIRRPQLRLFSSSGADAVEPFQLLAENLPQLVWTSLPDGRLEYVNQRWIDYTGLGVEESRGWSWKQAVHPDDLAACLDQWTTAVDQTQRYETEVRLRRGDGAYCWFLAQAAPIYDQEQRPVCWIGTYTDVTKIKHAVTNPKQREEALRKSERQLALVLDTAPVFIAHCGRDCRFHFINRAYAERLGRKPEELVGKHMAEVIGQAAYHVIKPYIDEALGGRTVEFEVEVDLLGLGRRWMHARYAPEVDGGVNGLVAVVTDITDRKQAEQAVQDGQRRLKLVSDHVPAMISYVDRDGVYRFNNARYEEWFGVKAKEVAGRHVREVLGEGVYQQRVPFIEQVLRGEMVRFEGPTRHQRLGVRETELAYVPDLGDDGAVRGFYVLAFDITERKQAEQALRESEERFRVMADAAPVLIWVSDSQKRGIYFNQRWLAFTGRSLEEECGDGWLAGIHPDDRERVAATCLEAFQRREPFRMEFRMRRADGAFRWVLDHGVPRFTEKGELAGYIGSCVDVTERRQAEQALQDSERRLKAVLELLPLPLFIADATGRLELTNPAADALWGGARRSEHPDAYAEDYQAWCSGTGKRVESYEWGMARALGGENVTAEEMELVGPAGQRRIFLNYARPIHNGDGQISGAVAVNVDVTELKEAEEKLREADRRKDEFLATLAHELRNPLAPVRNGLELMKMSKDDAAALEDIRSTMQRQTEQLTRLVDDLLDVSRITRGKLELRKSRVRIGEVVQTAVDSSAPLIDEAGHQLIVTLPDEAISIDGDSHRLAQVLSNLLNNAAKYTPEGGRIWISAEQDGAEVLLKVKDTGIGIPEDVGERIFEMFAQLDRSMETSFPGLGIGLTLAKSLVALHGGSIEVRSEGRARGSEFTVRLPLASSAPLEEDQTAWGLAPAAGAAQSKCRVLVVDDNKAAAKMLTMVIQKLGHEVCTANNGQQAIEMAAEFLPAVVLMDLGMPKMNGYEAARCIREKPWGKKMILVALTGWGQDEDKRRTKQAGFDHHLVKPTEPLELAKLLGELKHETP